MIGKVLRVILSVLVGTSIGFPEFSMKGLANLAQGHEQTRSVVAIHQSQIYLNSLPFVIKGVGYSPTPIGIDPETSNPPADNYTVKSSAQYQRDLPILREMGANTIRLWGWGYNADHQDFLDTAYNHGSRPVYVIPTYWINAAQDLNDPSIRQKIITEFRQMVALHKNHPAILMWMIGNELNAPWMYGNSDALFSLINEMALAAHNEEGAAYHPVTTPLADTDLIHTIQQRDSQVPNLDVWSVQLYRGSSFGNFFDDYSAVSDKPLFISEYGLDAYDDQRDDEYENVGPSYQAIYAASLWKEIEAHSTVCSGGSIMAYSDEWWKGKYGQKDAGHPVCPENDPLEHSTCGYATASGPDGYANEEWWGIMRPVKNGSNPDILQPRAVYATLQSLWVAHEPWTNEIYLPMVIRAGW
jgi:hypothetical protein